MRKVVLMLLMFPALSLAQQRIPYVDPRYPNFYDVDATTMTADVGRFQNTYSSFTKVTELIEALNQIMKTSFTVSDISNLNKASATATYQNYYANFAATSSYVLNAAMGFSNSDTAIATLTYTGLKARTGVWCNVSLTAGTGSNGITVTLKSGTTIINQMYLDPYNTSAIIPAPLCGYYNASNGDVLTVYCRAGSASTNSVYSVTMMILPVCLIP